jgi:ankyrin repeat protein
MSASHKRREQHLSLIMYRSKTGPPEVIQFIDGCIQGKLDLIAPHVKKKKRRRKLGRSKMMIDLNSCVLENTLPIFLAAQGKSKKHAALVRYFLNHNSKSRCPKTGRSVLHRACCMDAVEVAKELLSMKPNLLDHHSFDGSTALSLAAQCGSEKCLELLIKHGADPDIRTINKSTALYLACCKNHIAIVRILLDYAGADPSIPNSEGETPLFRSSANGNIELVKILLAIPSCSSSIEAVASSTANQTSLIAAARGNHLEICQVLLEAGANIEHGDSQGRTALYAASQEGYTEIVQLLINHNSDLEPHIENGSSPLLISAQRGHLNVVELLIKAGADLNIVDASDRSLFEVACLGGDFGVLNSLIKHGGCEKRWKVPVYLLHLKKKSDDRATKKRLSLARKIKVSQQKMNSYLREARVLCDTAIIQLKIAGEAAVKAGELAELAKQGFVRIEDDKSK